MKLRFEDFKFEYSETPIDPRNPPNTIIKVFKIPMNMELLQQLSIPYIDYLASNRSFEYGALFKLLYSSETPYVNFTKIQIKAPSIVKNGEQAFIREVERTSEFWRDFTDDEYNELIQKLINYDVEKKETTYIPNIKNKEGYTDIPAYTTVKKCTEEDIEKNRFHKLLSTIFYICDMAGFKLESRLVLTDRRTGKTFK